MLPPLPQRKKILLPPSILLLKNEFQQKSWKGGGRARSCRPSFGDRQGAKKEEKKREKGGGGGEWTK